MNVKQAKFLKILIERHGCPKKVIVAIRKTIIIRNQKKRHENTSGNLDSKKKFHGTIAIAIHDIFSKVADTRLDSEETHQDKNTCETWLEQ